MVPQEGVKGERTARIDASLMADDSSVRIWRDVSDSENSGQAIVKEQYLQAPGTSRSRQQRAQEEWNKAKVVSKHSNISTGDVRGAASLFFLSKGFLVR